MKKIFSICLALIMIISCTTSASAHETTVQDMVDYLVDQGLPESFLANRTEAEISEIYSTMYGWDIAFLGTETVTMAEITPSVDESASDTASIQGAIPEADMTLSITKVAKISHIPTLQLNMVNEVYVYVDYNWTPGCPFFTWDDGITVNWDPGVFTFKANSFVANDYKDTLSSGWITTQTLTSPTELDQGGLGYFAGLTYSEVVLGNTVGALQHKGSASFTLLPKDSPMYLKGGESVTAINAMYLHNKNVGPFSVSFTHTSGWGISANVAGLSDSVAKATNFYYSH